MHHGPVTPAIAKGLLALKERIKAAEIPPSKLDESINVAIWNVREFGKVKRSDAALHYIAEIMGQFDLVALVELRDNLEDLACVMDYLGEYWDVIYSDWMDDSGGNKERIAYLFDRRAAIFNGLAAEVDAPREKDASEYLAKQSFWRAPYMASFRAGNFDFVLIATHTRWGDSAKGRQNELQMLADWIGQRFQKKSNKSQVFEDSDLIVMGDFNVPKLDDAFFKALTSRGLQIPEALRQLKVGTKMIGGSNLLKNARFDQILHLPTIPKNFCNAGGTLDFYIDQDHIKELFPDDNLTPQKFTFQMSDHFPVWIQIKTDIDGFRLNQLIQNSRKNS
jgi:endonuclease/exonuclease/phosphatase family metal-dependent hydrolase